jgi:hypothetical protein
MQGASNKQIRTADIGRLEVNRTYTTVKGILLTYGFILDKRNSSLFPEQTFSTKLENSEGVDRN